MKPIGAVTRGTTNPNRLRRVDRYIASELAETLRQADGAPVVVDLGFGRVPTTAIELHARLRRVRSDLRVLGVEIDPERVEAAMAHQTETLRFVRGGFEVPVPTGWPRPTLIRAMNVLRQYDESDVAQAWQQMLAALADGGALVEGTCDELGRLGSWLTLDASGPRWLTLSWRLEDLVLPSQVAERLPKALIHRNTPGEPVHTVLQELDAAWVRTAGFTSLGVRQHFIETCRAFRHEGHPLPPRMARWRLGEMTIPWDWVKP